MAAQSSFLHPGVPHPQPHDDEAPIQIAGADAIALAGRALARLRFPDLAFADPRAEGMLARLDLDPGRFDAPRLRGAVLRTMLFDDRTRDFFRRHPEGLGIGFFSGMCTRFSRVDNGRLRWVDVETAGVAQFVAESQPANDRHSVAAACSVGCAGWMRHLADAGDMPTLIVVQGGFVGTPRCLIEAFFLAASRSCSAGVEILADFDARAPLRPACTGGRESSLEVLTEESAWVKFPRLRYVRATKYPAPIAHVRMA